VRKIPNVAVPGDRVTVAFVDVCQRAEAVPFDLENPFWMAKWEIQKCGI
jgi:hypothetical protein